MPTLFGLKNCDTCRKAAKALEAAGYKVVFHDVRDTPLAETELASYLELFGDRLVNTRSTTWRSLDANDRDDPPLALLKTHPTLMKRPIIEDEGKKTLGWSRDVQAEYLGEARSDAHI